MTSTWDELSVYGQLAANLLQRSYDLHKIKGPPGHWALGAISKIMRPDYHVQILEWANEYGGVFKFSLGCQWVVVVSDPAVAAQVLGRGELGVPRKCVGYQFFDLATNHLHRRSFFTTKDERQWAAVRKAVAPAFNMANVRRCYPFVLRHAQGIAAGLQDQLRQPGAHQGNGQALPLPSPLPSAAASQPPQQQQSRWGGWGPSSWLPQWPQWSMFGRGRGQAAQPDAAAHQGAAGSVAASQGSGEAVSGQPAGEAAGGAAPVALVDIQGPLEVTLLNVFLEALFDTDCRDFDGHAIADAMNLVLGEANERLKVPLRGLATYLTRPKAYAAVKRAQHELGRLYETLADLVIERRPALLREDDEAEDAQQRARPCKPRNGLSGPSPAVANLWTCLARLKDPHTGAWMTREQLVPEIGALLMAGFDTSSHTIAWCLFTLAAHPEVQDDVHRELASLGLLHGTGVPAREPSMDDLARLPALACVVDETMRLFPVAATASVREVSTPVRVGGYKLPPGVIVWPMVYALHNAEHNWSAPHMFKPERWRYKHSPAGHASSAAAAAAAEGGEGVESAARSSRAFLPFSDGIKNCLGQNLGLMEVRAVLVVLLSRFRFSLPPGADSKEQVLSRMVMSLTLKVKGGLRLACTPLTPATAPPGPLPRGASGNPLCGNVDGDVHQLGEEEVAVAIAPSHVASPEEVNQALSRHLAAAREEREQLLGAKQHHDLKLQPGYAEAPAGPALGEQQAALGRQAAHLVAQQRRRQQQQQQVGRWACGPQSRPLVLQRHEEEGSEGFDSDS